jgi:hypothetical protein
MEIPRSGFLENGNKEIRPLEVDLTPVGHAESSGLCSIRPGFTRKLETVLSRKREIG